MRSESSSFLRLVFLLALTPVASATTTWYVNGVSGSDMNNCVSVSTPCKTIGHAISRAAAGDSIRVAAATYKENLAISKSLTITGAAASTTIIDGGGVGTVVRILSVTAQVTLSELTIQHGFAQSNCDEPCPQTLGGGIYNSGSLIINNSIISGNQASSYCQVGSPYICSNVGGGIYSEGPLMMVKNSTLTGNLASAGCPFQLECPLGGGALAFSNSGSTVTLTNSTVVGNRAGICWGHSCSGAAIGNGLGNLVLNNSTISGNTGGIFGFGKATLQNSIVANNSGKNCRETITSHGYNLSSDTTCNFNGPGDMNSSNPMLGALGNYGGPTPTIPLLTGSPAIDAGNPSGCTDGHGNLLKTDQRGYIRPNAEDTGGCDIGAFERQSD